MDGGLWGHESSRDAQIDGHGWAVLTELQGVWLTCGSHALLMPHSMLDVAHLRPGLLVRSVI